MHQIRGRMAAGLNGSPKLPCISAITYAFPAATRSVRELAAAGQLHSEAEVMERFGFDCVRVAVEESPYELVTEAASRLLAEHEIDPASIGLLVYGGAPGRAAFAPADAPDPGNDYLRSTERFKYPATRLQYDLGLDHASVLGVDQLACTNLLAGVRIARSLCLTEGIDRALCVMAEFFPADGGREKIYNCISDAACAVLVEREGTRNRLVASTHITKGYYWDGDALHNEIVASYFPTAKYAIEQTLTRAGWGAEEVDWVIPHNVSLRSWQLLLGLVRLPNARLWSENIARDGHTLAGDNFINLCDALQSGAIQPGQKLLLFSYGYGAHWTGLAVEA
jgi:3-oxoacyl-[acyl-carrier-protein] synthase-3